MTSKKIYIYAGLHSSTHIKIVLNPVKPKWRNRQSGMAYRQLGNTGLMISEVVSGGDPVRQDNLRITEIAMERGLNYLDMAPAYGRGECEISYGKVIDNSSKREKVNMTTKISGYTSLNS